MVWHLDVGFSNIKKKDSYKWECSSHTLGTWAGFRTMEISLVYIFNTTIQGTFNWREIIALIHMEVQKNVCSVRKDR